LVEGEPDTGKSTFAAQMKAPILPIDADHRFAEVVDLAGGPVFQLSGDPLDNVDPDRIAALVSEGMRGSGTKTIVVDSLTAIIAPLVTKAFRGNAAGENRNRVAAYAQKATAMRLLQDVLTGTGCDIAWIYHVYQGRDSNAREVERTSITELELSRVLRSCNMRIRLARQGGVYTATVVWARRGRSGMTIQDTSGKWDRMPERIEEAVYGGLTQADQDAIEHAVPEVFANAADAMRWGMDQGVFKDEAHAQNTYELVKRAKKPATAARMRDLWVAEVQARQAGGSTLSEAERQEANGQQEAS
jgi:hypothetical protein